MQDLHGGNEPLRPARIAQTPAGHGVAFGHAVHRQRTRNQLRRGLSKRGERGIVVTQRFVNVVGHHQHLRVIRQHVCQRAQLLFAVNRPGRVARRIEDQPAR